MTLVVAVGFALFALDEISRASRATQERIAGYEATDPAQPAERTRERRNGRARELIDDANDLLLRPFAAVVPADADRWVQRGLPALLGLFLYGFLLSYVARYGRAHG